MKRITVCTLVVTLALSSVFGEEREVATAGERVPEGAASTAPQDPVDWVDPLLGTAGSRWMLIPGPTLPFGMVNLSPDTQDGGWKAGHDYNSPTITGFSHIHSWVMGGLLTMPATGPLMIVPGN